MAKGSYMGRRREWQEEEDEVNNTHVWGMYVMWSSDSETERPRGRINK